MTARTKRPQKEKLPEAPPPSRGWIDPKKGLQAIAVVSILCALWTGYQVSQFRGPLDAILWGIIFGATIWLIAGFAYLVNRWMRRS